MKLEEALDYCQRLGLDGIELPAGGWPGDPWKLGGIHKDKARLQELKEALQERELEVLGVAVHGNPVHPDKKLAAAYHKHFQDAVALAAEFGSVVITFSGCPGGSASDRTPNWVTCPWPDVFTDVLNYQWDKVLIPYWKKQNAFAAEYGVKIALEAHPGFCVYNPETVVRLRDAAGKQIGINLDPSHLFWQGIDPVAAAHYLGQHKCIFHVHAKDTRIDPVNSAIHGNLDTKSYSDVANRSWVFRTVGYGHGDDFWKAFISVLRTHGYDGVLSIEHEDSLMSVSEGFEKAVAYLKNIVLRGGGQGLVVLRNH